jgi:hypothetical protein
MCAQTNAGAGAKAAGRGDELVERCILREMISPRIGRN